MITPDQIRNITPLASSFNALSKLNEAELPVATQADICFAKL
jgi:hypothetical protein